jgi:hypothetical protein
MTSCIVSTNDVGEKLKCLICGYEKNNKTDWSIKNEGYWYSFKKPLIALISGFLPFQK